MEQLIGKEIVQGENKDTIPAESLFKFKEFLLLFYGASWCKQSRLVAKYINELMAFSMEKNVGEDKNIEVFYLSNDRTEDEWDRFYLELLGAMSVPVPWNTLDFS